MNISFDYYLATNNYDTYPAWVKGENYFYCEHFSSFFRFFKRR